MLFKVFSMDKKERLNRVIELEQKHQKPMMFHIIIKELAHKDKGHAFDDYMKGRIKEEYTPIEGWTALKKLYLSNSRDNNTFITIHAAASIAPNPPKITRGQSR